VSSVIAYLGLGANLGNRRANLSAAIDQLAAHDGIDVIAVSALYESAPVGGPPDQPDFLNAAAAVRTMLAADALLDIAQQIEGKLGRRRIPEEPPNQPRTIDIDVLMVADQVHNTARLILPHPRMHERAFVLRPLSDIAADQIHPTRNRRIEDLLTDLPAPTRIHQIEGSTWWTPKTYR
jgi:2-amino-4-hydroxy-6-hydroxymethyldihydropteridine diphosphokinase